MSQAITFAATKGFGSVGNDLKWYCPPPAGSGTSEEQERTKQRGWWAVEESKLLLAPPPKKDFWRKSYYQPLLVKDDGPFLYKTVSMKDLPVTIETSFTITGNSTSQFDQGGIMIRLDHEHWLKTGIEMVDGQARLSCVVTNCFSDWSTQMFPRPEIKIRVHILPQQGGSFVVEAAPLDSEEWAFIRIAHMNKNMKHDLLNDHETVRTAYQGEDPPDDSMWVGVFGACPVDQVGMIVTFHDLSIVQGSTFVHDC